MKYEGAAAKEYIDRAAVLKRVSEELIQISESMAELQIFISNLLEGETIENETSVKLQSLDLLSQSIYCLGKTSALLVDRRAHPLCVEEVCGVVHLRDLLERLTWKDAIVGSSSGDERATSQDAESTSRLDIDWL